MECDYPGAGVRPPFAEAMRHLTDRSHESHGPSSGGSNTPTSGHSPNAPEGNVFVNSSSHLSISKEHLSHSARLHSPGEGSMRHSPDGANRPNIPLPNMHGPFPVHPSVRQLANSSPLGQRHRRAQSDTLINNNANWPVGGPSETIGALRARHGMDENPMSDTMNLSGSDSGAEQDQNGSPHSESGYHSRSLSIEDHMMLANGYAPGEVASPSAQNAGAGNAAWAKRNRRGSRGNSSIDSLAVNIDELDDEEAVRRVLASKRLQDAEVLDPKRAKRILANRQSAARSKERKTRYIVELEEKISLYEKQISALKATVSILQRETSSLAETNEGLGKKMQLMEKLYQQREAENKHLLEQIDLLKQAAAAATAAASAAAVSAGQYPHQNMPGNVFQAAGTSNSNGNNSMALHQQQGQQFQPQFSGLNQGSGYQQGNGSSFLGSSQLMHMSEQELLSMLKASMPQQHQQQQQQQQQQMQQQQHHQRNQQQQLFGGTAAQSVSYPPLDQSFLNLSQNDPLLGLNLGQHGGNQSQLDSTSLDASQLKIIQMALRQGLHLTSGLDAPPPQGMGHQSGYGNQSNESGTSLLLNNDIASTFKKL